MPERSCFRTPFQSQGVHRSQTLLKPSLQQFYSNFPLIQDKLSWKTSLLVRSEILGLFGNTLTTITSVLVIVEGNSRNKFKRYYLKNGKHFLTFLFHFCNLYEILRISQQKDQLHSFNISKVTEHEKCRYFDTQSFCFRTPFQSQRVHGSKTLLKAALQHLYHNFPLL